MLMQETKRVKNPRKQRKNHFNAPAHLRHKRMGAPLSRELAASRGVRTLPVRKGDTVRIQRGDHKGFEGKVSRVDLKEYRIYLEGLTREKVDGTNIFLSIHPSKVEIRNLNLDDNWRKNVILPRKKAIEKPEKKVKPKAKPAKKPAKAKAQVEEEKAIEKEFEEVAAPEVAEEEAPVEKAPEEEPITKKAPIKKTAAKKPAAKKTAPAKAKEAPEEKVEEKASVAKKAAKPKAPAKKAPAAEEAAKEAAVKPRAKRKAPEKAEGGQ
jgi:large subunit ribosomal protein L24